MIKLKNDHPNLSNCAKITFSWQLTLTFAQSESFLNWIILDRSVQDKQDRTYWRLTFFNTNTHVIELLPTTFDSAVFFWVWTCLLTKKKKKHLPFLIQKRGVDHGPQHGHILLLAVHDSNPSILQPDVAASQVWIYGILYFPLYLTVVSGSLSWFCFPLGLVLMNCSLQIQHCG